ncbi:MAG: hypothetical protein M3Q93_07975 [Gemmatimonadota bacterium]|nr:hypothetical protein [Gemmatimonadales bacterium]MDQ3137509.1 hypothetical protein [Gemmatimonadota bacterium]
MTGIRERRAHALRLGVEIRRERRRLDEVAAARGAESSLGTMGSRR